MYFVYRDGNYINALGQSFRDFMKGELPALPGELPTLSDWADHLTTIFPEARLKKFIEMRVQTLANGTACVHYQLFGWVYAMIKAPWTRHGI